MPESIRDVLPVVARHRVIDVLAQHAEALELGPDLAAALAALRDHDRRRRAIQVLEIGDMQTTLSSAGISSLVFKGLPLAVQTTGDPGARGVGDLDLLVDPASVQDAYDALTALGYVLRSDSEGLRPGTWAWRHVLRASASLSFGGPGSNIDLHWRLDPTLDGLPSFAEVWERRARVDIGGIQVETLAPVDLLPHSASHAAKDQWRWLRSLVDVHRLAGMPQTWEGRATRPGRLELETLAVTRRAIGLPPSVPTEVLARVDRVRGRLVAAGIYAQDRPIEMDGPAPGRETFHQLRYMLVASATPRDLTHAAVATLLPEKVVARVGSRTAWTGVPKALLGRLSRTRRRVLGWLRRGHAVAPVGVVDDAAEARSTVRSPL